MILTVAPTSETDLAEVRALLVSAFGGDRAASADATLLRWKYLEPRADCPGPRGFALKEGDRLVAHCGAVPVSFLLPHGEVRGVCFMDWVRRGDCPGAGALLMRKLMEMNGISVVAGGTQAARAAIARMPFVTTDTIEYFLRSVHPWKQFVGLGPSASPWRAPARLMRNAVWSLWPPARPVEGWSAVRVDRFGPEACANRPARSATLTRRDPEVLDFWLRCPVGDFAGYLLRQWGRSRGHFLLDRVGHQARIADLRVDSDDPEAWRAAVALAAERAAESPDVHEITAIAASPRAREALLANGFHVWGRAPWALHDPAGALAGHAPVHWNLIDDDTAIL